MDLESLLRKKLEKTKKIPDDELLEMEDDLYKLHLKEYGVDLSEETKPSIPRFFYRLPRDNEPLRQKLREETRSSFLDRKSRQLLDNAELKALWALLDEHQTSPDDHMITYANFKKVVELADPKVKLYLTANVFAKLHENDPQGRVSTISLFNYIMRKVWLKQTRVGLSLYDTTGLGYLREAELENYISELLPVLPQLEGLEKSFHSFYVCTVVRKFMFFLDKLRAGRVRILDVLACSFLDDLLELRQNEVGIERSESNWFSAPSALSVYGNYLNLDKDHNGMLSLEELSRYGTGTLTQPFLERVFQTCLTYKGEMDYKTYLDLVLALENRSEPQALAFLFKILDLNDSGYLDAFTINYFFRAIQEQLRDADLVIFEDFKDELFDMVKPKNPDRITLSDLYACGKGETFVSILIEFQAFLNYEYRDTSSNPTQE
ncbi:PREDICTED: serine/threonine-protein phosphatase 2A regulatory subunit B'' subunit gamma-like [Nicrophorus vespilloides]|uniref:Serine/threonine-protein phosphatase 2A regulatory subunit B'' subunit gamma-like n=1 Tax=Nicrophorus vespilloides TaxID=110193 RepID=A0ABM1MSW5_NICVS|nr:PREDICTED: serine/threonine-protein phosphatase 2A regulatory subunit B'' subunit gamma-like [Nicrophorus vespilloides]